MCLGRSYIAVELMVLILNLPDLLNFVQTISINKLADGCGRYFRKFQECGEAGKAYNRYADSTCLNSVRWCQSIQADYLLYSAS